MTRGGFGVLGLREGVAGDLGVVVFGEVPGGLAVATSDVEDRGGRRFELEMLNDGVVEVGDCSLRGLVAPLPVAVVEVVAPGVAVEIAEGVVVVGDVGGECGLFWGNQFSVIGGR